MRSDVLINMVMCERNARIDKSNPASKFIYRSYTTLISKLQESFNDGENITDEKIDRLSVTDHMRGKLKKMIKVKPKKVSKKGSKKNSDVLIHELIKLMGLGDVKAQGLVNQGLISVEQLKTPPWFDKLPVQTRTMLENEPSRKIPYCHISKLENILTKPKILGMKVILVGSYRRQASYSRDIDVMIVSDKPNAMDKYLEYFKTKFNCVVYSVGVDKMSLVFDPRPVISTAKFYKIDVFLTVKKYESAMLLYLTGSKAFNIRMRAKAKAQGYLLNQNGLYIRKNGKSGRRISIESEKDFFLKLGMDYVDSVKRG